MDSVIYAEYEEMLLALDELKHVMRDWESNLADQYTSSSPRAFLQMTELQRIGLPDKEFRELVAQAGAEPGPDYSWGYEQGIAGLNSPVVWVTSATNPDEVCAAVPVFVHAESMPVDFLWVDEDSGSCRGRGDEWVGFLDTKDRVLLEIVESGGILR